MEEAEEEEEEELIVRPVFFYNSPQQLGETLSLHLFEPRYRLMIARVVETHSEFVYLGNGQYKATMGDVGLVCKITQFRILPDGRALVSGVFTRKVLIVAHWTEEDSGELSYCVGLTRPPFGWLDEIVRDGDRITRIITAYLRARHVLMEDLKGEYTVRHRMAVYRDDPQILPDGTVHAEVVRVLDRGTVVKGVECLPIHARLGEFAVIRARIREPVAGFIVFGTSSMSFLEPRGAGQSVALEGCDDVEAVQSPGSLSVLLLGGTHAHQQLVEERLRAMCGPDLRSMCLLSHREDFVAFQWLCEHLAEVTAQNMDLTRSVVQGLPVLAAFGQPVGPGAVVLHVPETTSIPLLRAKEMAESWSLEYGVLYSPHAPQHVPFFATISCEQSSFCVHHTALRLSRWHAFRRLRFLSAKIYWDQLRLLLIGHGDEQSTLALLPTEVVRRVCEFVAPDAFLHVLAGREKEWV